MQTSKPKDSPQQETDFDGWEERLAAYRKEHFAVTTDAPRKNGGTVTLSITTNGNQWQTIGLMPEEIQHVIQALIPFLPNANVDASAVAATPNQNQTT